VAGIPWPPYVYFSITANPLFKLGAR